MGVKFVDCHSHVVPSGDDGAQTLADGLELCELAHASGTDVLYATPHVWPHLLLGPERERRIRSAFAKLREAAPLDLRLGWELTPTAELLDEDPTRYVLEGTDVVLVEVPFAGLADGLLQLAEQTVGIHEAHNLDAETPRRLDAEETTGRLGV